MTVLDSITTSAPPSASTASAAAADSPPTCVPQQMRMTAAAALLKALEEQGVDTVFGYPGGAIMPVYDALPASNIKHILARHEQGAAFSADAYARVTGRAGVCMATSGPGATNLITGLANAHLDSIPMVAITGQVPTFLMGTDAFQEVDILGMTLPCVKHSWLVRNADEIEDIVAKAFEVAQSGRPGPVLIDLPKDVAQSMVTYVGKRDNQPCASTYRPNTAPSQQELEAAAVMLTTAKKPVAYIGGGVPLSGGEQALRDFIAATGLPSVATLKGLGSLAPETPHYMGMLGMHGQKAANQAVHDSDLLVCIGARFDDRATGKLDSFAPHADVIHIDIDPSQISKLRRATVGLCGSVPDVLRQLPHMRLDIDSWRAEVDATARANPIPYDAPGDGVYAPALLKELSETAGDDFIAACDVGQHQMWVAQHCRFARPQAHLTSGGLGAMGYGLPAGIGAKLAEPEAQVVTISGDGSFMMNIQELATIKRYGLNLKILLLDNSALGMVRQWQELFYDENFSEVDLSDNPDFAQVARSFGIDAFTLDKRQDVTAAINKLLNHPGACLCHVKIDPRENVWPLVPPGASNVEMMNGA